jgi:nucleotide-binding universal stress UspA family protein
MIVLGSSNRTDLPHIPFGSVPHRLLHLARRPVLIVPRQETR